MLKGQKAVVRYSIQNMSGEINVVVANKYLVTITGGSVPKSTLLEYAKSVDFSKMLAS